MWFCEIRLRWWGSTIDMQFGRIRVWGLRHYLGKRHCLGAAPALCSLGHDLSLRPRFFAQATIRCRGHILVLSSAQSDDVISLGNSSCPSISQRFWTILLRERDWSFSTLFQPSWFPFSARCLAHSWNPKALSLSASAPSILYSYWRHYWFGPGFFPSYEPDFHFYCYRILPTLDQRYEFLRLYAEIHQTWTLKYLEVQVKVNKPFLLFQEHLSHCQCELIMKLQDGRIYRSHGRYDWLDQS